MSIQRIRQKCWEYFQESAVDTAILQGRPVFLKGMVGSLKALFLASLFEHTGVPALVVLPDREEAEWLADEMDLLLGEGVVGFFPASEWENVEASALNPRKAGMQMQVLRDLRLGKMKAVVTCAQGILLKIPSPQLLRDSLVQVLEGAELDPYNLMKSLHGFGYTRESVVERPGEFSLRGGILDVFPYTGEDPHRIEFFGNRVESIRIFDIASQRSKGRGSQLTLVPPIGIDSERTSSLFHYFGNDRILFLEDPELVLTEAEKERQRGRQDVWDPETVETYMAEGFIIRHHTLASPEGAVEIGGRSPQKLGVHATEIRRQLEALAGQAHETFLVCENEEQRGRIHDLLAMDEDPIIGVSVVVAPLKKGFLLPRAGLSVYTEADLFGRAFRKRKKGKFKEGLPIRELSTLVQGDFVVHVDYGIGRYLGLERIRVRDVERECLALLYRDGDKLYVPIDKMERIQKYRSREGASPELSKLGGVQWEKLKSKTKQNVKEIARDLIALYSARHALPGHPFSPDTLWQKELEAGFAYEETPDQFRAIEEVRTDMEASKPMDRLVCGDVGYGKTEVAIRAAFKCVSDGKQAAVLVPTTILAQQHFRTFQERLSAFPVNVEVLSRFRSRKEQLEIIRKAKNAELDIVIGTHRLLSKDVGFKALGLLVIDEEQRFGVKHKEALKKYRKTVDVLTLTATPIPRTLYFSMMGIRDMSLINTPPKDRHPIITEVLPFSEEVVEEAIRHELERGGQVFFVHNRVKSIHAVAGMVERLVPGIRIAVAHGQMNEHQLEKVMLDFDAGRTDCLVTTTIIESGLDLPNANTLLVNRADQMGLAQLYQLRGRVGRSDHQAYAYLFTPPFELLNEEAIKRLRTIEEFTELGSGFQVAQRDLEIRGAGNLLGLEQSGNLDALGYDLYLKLVEEAVRELKSEMDGVPAPKPDLLDCQVEVELDAFLPGTYVTDESIRVQLYQKLASLGAAADVESFAMELKDRFGSLPPEAERLLEGAQLRLTGKALGLKKITIGNGRLRIYFHDQWADRLSSPEQFSDRLRKMVDSSAVPVRFIQKGGFGLEAALSSPDTFREAKKILQSIG